MISDEQLKKDFHRLLGYEFQKVSLLKRALTHSSYLHEKPNAKSYERLEFFGDAILNFVISKVLMDNIPKANEGQLTRARAAVVCSENLINCARSIGFASYIRFGKNELSSLANKDSVLEDVMESLICAIYEDGGFNAAEIFILSQIWKRSKEIAISTKAGFSAKAFLLERAQKNGVSVEYKVINHEGPQHNATFHVEVFYNGIKTGKGAGRSIKKAEEEASRVALSKFKELS